MAKRYKSVLEMVRDSSGDKTFVDEFERHTDARAVVRHLAVSRAARQLSQEELATRLGWTQSRISKLESAEDAEVRLGDLAHYAAALGIPLSLTFTKQGWEIIVEGKASADVEGCFVRFRNGELTQLVPKLAGG